MGRGMVLGENIKNDRDQVWACDGGHEQRGNQNTWEQRPRNLITRGDIDLKRKGGAIGDFWAGSLPAARSKELP